MEEGDSLKLGTYPIFIFLLVGVLLLAGCQEYFGQEARGQNAGQQSGTTIPSYEPVLGRDLLKQLDANGNGEIDQEDFFAFSESFGKTDTESLYKFDYDLDGDIDNDDFLILSENFGKKVKKEEIPPFNINEYFLNVGEKLFVNDIELRLSEVGSNGDVFVEVTGISGTTRVTARITITSGDSIIIRGLSITNKEQFYDSKNPRASAATLIIEVVPIGGGGLNGDYNGNGCIDAKSSDDGTLTGEDGEAFMKYYNDGDKRADLDGNGVVDLEDVFLFSEQVGKYGCKEEPAQEMMEITFSRDTGFDSELVEAFGSNFYSQSQSNPTSAVLISSSHRTLNISLMAKNFIPARSVYFTGSVIGTDKIWVSAYNRSAIGVYYENTNGVTQLAGTININKAAPVFDASSAIFIDTGKTTLFAEEMFIVVNGTQTGSSKAFNVTGSSLQLTMEVRKRGSSFVNDTLWTNWTLSHDDVNSLGFTQSWEESDEVRLNYIPVGTRDKDIMGRSGIVLKNPKANGASDKVRFEIPLGASPAIDRGYYLTGSWKCYDGSTGLNKDLCSPHQDHWDLAVKFCSGKCNADNSKCGVDSFSVRDEC